jgi:two-component system response regulator HydG
MANQEASHRSDPVRRVLVVDDRIEMAETLADGLAARGYESEAVASGAAALARLATETFDVVVTDLRMPDIDGLELVAAARKSAPDTPIIVMTAYGAIDTAVESIRRGAFHYLTKPFKTDELVLFIERAVDQMRDRREARALRKALRERYAISQIVGPSAGMQAVLDVVERVIDTDVPVLILGETGTGKGLVARALHTESRRAQRSFVAVNCAALPESLLESELFGHVKGAFTGASSAHHGLFGEADGGTIFLDEIAEMSLSLQAKLLHALESRTIRPVGSSREVSVDVRVIAATNRNLRQLAQQQRFREDLLYRLEVVSIEIPPLRHRPDDIPVLIEHFLQSAKLQHPTSPVERISEDAMQKLVAYEWRGNVRELSHMVERFVLLGRHPEVAARDLPPTVTGQLAHQSFAGEVKPVRQLQRAYALWALRQMDGHKGHTAERLEIDVKTLNKWLGEETDERES